MEQQDKTKKIFIIILPVIGWLITGVGVPLINWALGGAPQEDMPGFLILTSILYLFVWVPVGIIGYRMFKKKGYKNALIFLLIALAVSVLLVQGCLGIPQ